MFYYNKRKNLKRNSNKESELIHKIKENNKQLIPLRFHIFTLQIYFTTNK